MYRNRNQPVEVSAYFIVSLLENCENAVKVVCFLTSPTL